MVDINLIIEEEEQKFKIPTDWSEVTVEQFTKLFAYNREGLSQLEIVVKTISIFSGIDEDILMLMEYNDFLKLAEVIEYTTKEVEPQSIDKIDVDGDQLVLNNKVFAIN